MFIKLKILQTIEIVQLGTRSLKREFTLAEFETIFATKALC